MAREPLPPNERRDQEVRLLVTRDEKEDVLEVARELGMSTSNAGRYLIMLGITEYQSRKDTR